MLDCRRFRLPLTRRECLRIVAGAAIGGGPAVAPLRRLLAANTNGKRRCILLWMSGGPSQLDTFDLKPGHANGGPFKEIQTATPGIRFSEHLPQLARRSDHLAIIRSMSTKEGDHERATYHLRTGYPPGSPVRYPALGSVLGKELGDDLAELPNYVSIAPARAISPAAFGPGFLGPAHAPLVVTADAGGADFRVRNLDTPENVDADRLMTRKRFVERMQGRFNESRPGAPTASHRAAYGQAFRMIHAGAGSAFALEKENDSLRDRYGRNAFGQGCLLARRLSERGVPFVEVNFNGISGNPLGWDTHQDNFETVKTLSGILDAAWSTLLDDLKDRGLLESTLIVWAGEFGRTPRINENVGRDHYPAAWSTVLAGGAVAGGSVVGKTSSDGVGVVDRPVAVADLAATVCLALGADPLASNISNVGRPIRLADYEAKPLLDLVAR